jgi:hypothetical protein
MAGEISQVAYTTPGTYQWTCPSGVTSVSVVCVGGGGGAGGGGYIQNPGGGGGLGYKNNIAVQPGVQYTVVVGAGGTTGFHAYNGRFISPQYCNGESIISAADATPTVAGDSYFINASTVKGGGGRNGVYSSDSECFYCNGLWSQRYYGSYFTPVGGSYTGDGGGAGNGGQHSYITINLQNFCNAWEGWYTTHLGAGGKGAGGWGAGPGTNSMTIGSGGGGDGGNGGRVYWPWVTVESTSGWGAQAGGVGLLGSGSTGSAGANIAVSGSEEDYTLVYPTNGTAGSGGSVGGYGAGAPGSMTIWSGASGARSGGNGAVRIIWGPGRAFPSTNCGNI